METTAMSLKNSEIDDGKKSEEGSRIELWENNEEEEEEGEGDATEVLLERFLGADAASMEWVIESKREKKWQLREQKQR